MSKGLRTYFLIAARCLLLHDPDGAKRHPSHWSVKRLEHKLKDADVLILDARPLRCAAQHIPGAVNVDAFTYGGLLFRYQMERRIQSWGVSAGKKTSSTTG
jgi:hypothetical protein